MLHSHQMSNPTRPPRIPQDRASRVAYRRRRRSPIAAANLSRPQSA